MVPADNNSCYAVPHTAGIGLRRHSSSSSNNSLSNSNNSNSNHSISSNISNHSCDPTAAVPFPWKLHRILDDAAIKGFNNIVSWVPSQNGFKVHNTKVFDAEIMPNYFNNTKYKSFQRQLNMWGFDRVGSGPHKGAYLHPFFIRGKPDLCESMQRTKIKGIHSKKLRKSFISGMGCLEVGGVGEGDMNSNSNSNSNTDINMSMNMNMDAVAAATVSSSIDPVSSTSGGEEAAAIDDFNASLQAAANKVADLERQKEEIQRKLKMVSTQAATAAANSSNNTMTTIPRVSVTSTTSDFLGGQLELGQQGQGQDQGQGQASSDYMQPLTGATRYMNEGDSLFFGGRNFFFVDQVNKLQEQQPFLEKRQQEQRQRGRRFSRRYSLELKGPDSDEYILKELEQDFDGRADADTTADDGSSSNNAAFNSQLELDLKFALNAGALSSSSLPNASDCSQLSPTPLPPSHSSQNSQHHQQAIATDISNTNSSLIIGLDKPKRRFSFLSTPVQNPFDKPYEIPPKPSSLGNLRNHNVNVRNNNQNQLNFSINDVIDLSNDDNDIYNDNSNHNNVNMNNAHINVNINNIRNINRNILKMSTRVSF